MASRTIAVVLLVALSGAQAQEVIPDFYKGPGLDPNRSYLHQGFAEHIDPFNGSLQLHYTDIHVPGNGGFNLQVTRSYNSASVNELDPASHYGSAGVGWTVHFGRVVFKATIGACGGTAHGDTLNNPVLELPDGSSQVLVRGLSTAAPLISTQRWRAECTGAGLVVHSPAGIRYEMTQAVGLGGSPARTAYYTTRISDRNDNYANVSYASAGSPEVTRVESGEGHRIDFEYVSLSAGETTRRIRRIISRDSTGDRAYAYSYQAIPGTGAFQLISVLRPDGQSWQFQYNESLATNAPGSHQLRQLTYPEGGTVTYSYGSSVSDYVNFDAYAAPSARNRVSVVKQKATSDGGSWSFTYQPGRLGTLDVTTVKTPGGTIIYQHVGPNYASGGSLWMVGLLMRKQLGSEQSETYTWVAQPVSTQTFRRPGLWQASRSDDRTYAPVLAGRTITRDGANHSTIYRAFDDYGNPQTIEEAGPLGGNRTTALTYYYNTSRWIVKQPKNQVVVGGVSIEREFDSRGNLVTYVRDGVKTVYVPTTAGDVARAEFPRDASRRLIHTYADYKRGIARSEAQPESVNITRTVSDSGNLLSEVNGRGFATSYQFDGLNRITRIIPPRGNPTTIAYTQTTKMAVRYKLTESTTYDGFGRPINITLADIPRAYRYDALGRMTFASNAGAAIGTTYAYDTLDRVRTVINPGNATSESTDYGPGTRVVRNERNYSTTYTYRSYGDPGERHLMRVDAPAPEAAASIVIGRDAKDLIRTISQGGFTRTYEYFPTGYLWTVTHPETGTTTYGRDLGNNMTSRTVSGAGTTTYTYDDQNRLRTIIYPEGTPPVSKSYTRTHKLEAVTSSVASRSFRYDANDNLDQETLTVDGHQFVLTSNFNGNDQLESLVYPRSGRVVAYGPDTLGRPGIVSGFATEVRYWPSGQLAHIAYANGTLSTYGQNERLWPQSFVTGRGATDWVRNNYTYDGVGNLRLVADSVDGSYNREYGYDAIDRLVSVSGALSGTLTYDGAGNLRSQQFGSAGLLYSYDATTNRLSGVSGGRIGAYSYGAHGQVTGTGTHTYIYDAVPNLTCANCSDAATATSYTYDGLNMRVSSQRHGIKTYEFYSFNGNLLTEFTPALANRLAEHIYLGGRRIASAGPAPTAVVLPASNPSVVAGQPFTLTARIAGGVSPTGTVRFFDGPTLIGTSSLAAGQAALTITFHAAGPHSINAIYSGDGQNLGSSASAAVQVLSTSTIGGPARGLGYLATAGKATLLSASIGGSSPTGTLSFYVGSTLLGVATLSGGNAALAYTFTTPGSYTVTIVYSGDDNNAPSTGTATLTVNLDAEQMVPMLQLLLAD